MYFKVTSIMPIVSEKIIFNRLIFIVPDHLTVTKIIGPLFQFSIIDLVDLSLSRYITWPVCK